MPMLRLIEERARILKTEAQNCAYARAARGSARGPSAPSNASGTTPTLPCPSLHWGAAKYTKGNEFVQISGALPEKAFHNYPSRDEASFGSRRALTEVWTRPSEEQFLGDQE